MDIDLTELIESNLNCYFYNLDNSIWNETGGFSRIHHFQWTALNYLSCMTRDELELSGLDEMYIIKFQKLLSVERASNTFLFLIFKSSTK